MSKTNEIAFGGGCHWCTEAVFQTLKGVVNVKMGFVSSEGAASSFSEAVVVEYNQDHIGLFHLILIHLHTHHSTSSHSMRTKYRSAIYTFNEVDTIRSKEYLQQLQASFNGQLITQVLPFVAFRSADPQFYNYYLTDTQKPFCKRYIAPKIALLLKQFPQFVDANSLAT
ncbi:peptide-methionine (S)-S-oxide reductase [Arenibacter lacus]|uniref:peptide-methionine (S)-S-oxide reductase n=1 Tax=Arenibacter lacus TaxID=2608629 RepID=UPI00123D3CA7|nr:peptide-methionine (S)-S-oxide reductase [Arenibacter lacus]